jgi:Amt family ammonium transporter
MVVIALAFQFWPATGSLAQEPEPSAGEQPSSSTGQGLAGEQVEPPTIESVGKSVSELTSLAGDMTVAIDTMWVLVTAMLVFFMNLGFATVESGFCRAKNCVNILSKNFVVFAITSVGFWLLGFGLMFGNGAWVGGEGVWMVNGFEDGSPATGAAYQGPYVALNWTGVPLAAKFFFQLVFAGTAATIVSGCVAERIKYHSFILFAFVMSIAVYPVVGHWIWGGGFLAPPEAGKPGMLDFAGSTVVHSIGGWAGLAGILVLGPRIGKYAADGTVRPIPGHNLTAATIGCFVLWLGWFGFNPGSTMGATGANISLIGHVCVTTNSAAATGVLTATLTSWVLMRKPDLGMTLNGCLAGLVAVTAPCAFISVPSAMIIGAIAGVLVVVAVILFDKLRIDDPVGALSVHLVNGVFGTICVGLFCMAELTPTKQNGFFIDGSTEQLINQLKAVLACAGYVFIVSLVAWVILKVTVGIRVSRDEEIEGLDVGEHGNEAYSGFQMIRDA